MENTISLGSLVNYSFPLIIFVIFMSSKYLTKKKNLPPSPRKLPIIGNLHQLGSFPHRSLHALSQKHGPIMLLHLGSVPTLVASSAEAAKEILKTHDLSFCSRPNRSIPNILFYGGKNIALSPYGELWKQQRSVAVVHLLSIARVKSFLKVRENQVDHMIGELEKRCDSLVDISSFLFSFSTNIICKVTIGKTYDGLKFKNLMSEFLSMLIVLSVGSFIPWLAFVDRVTGLVGRAKKIAKEFDKYLEDIIAEQVNKDDSEVKNFVEILLDIEKDNSAEEFAIHRDTIKAVILEMFLGGTDTTPTLSEMALSELIRNPRIMKTLQEEVTKTAQGRSKITEEDLDKMHYLKAVVKETLRLHPPIPLLAPHMSTQDVKLMGYDIQAGTQVLVNVWAIARDPALWDEPMEFQPERFLNSSINYGGVHFEWLPFGAGRRRCPGIQFGVAVVELALANIVYKFDLELPNGMKNEDLDMSETFGILVRRKAPLMVIPRPRF